jgi:plastocyanin
MEGGAEIVRLRRYLLVILIATLGAWVVLLPAVAGSETSPAIEAVNVMSGTGIYAEQTHSWSPSQATVAAGGVVTISNHTAVAHGVEWREGPETPTCSAGVPVGTTPAHSGPNWSGTCTFAKAGVYTFYCTVHGPEMTGTVTVNADGSTTISAPAMTGSGSPASTPAGSGEPVPAGTPGTPGSSGSPLAGSARAALKLAGEQHGESVHGSLAVSQAGAGGRLELDLLAASSSLKASSHAAQVRVGRLVHPSLRAGSVSFTVALDTAARRALRRRGHLSLTLRIVLTPAHGSAVRITRTVLLGA